MNTEHHARRHPSHSIAHSELERRLIRACVALQQARCHLHEAHQAVMDAEATLMARKLEREEAVLRVAELAEIIESLQREIEWDNEAANVRDAQSARQAMREPEAELAGST